MDLLPAPSHSDVEPFSLPFLGPSVEISPTDKSYHESFELNDDTITAEDFWVEMSKYSLRNHPHVSEQSLYTLETCYSQYGDEHVSPSPEEVEMEYSPLLVDVPQIEQNIFDCCDMSACSSSGQTDAFLPPTTPQVSGDCTFTTEPKERLDIDPIWLQITPGPALDPPQPVIQQHSPSTPPEIQQSFWQHYSGFPGGLQAHRNPSDKSESVREQLSGDFHNHTASSCGVTSSHMLTPRPLGLSLNTPSVVPSFVTTPTQPQTWAVNTPIPHSANAEFPSRNHLSPFHTPIQPNNNHNRRYSNPVVMSSPAFSYSFSPAQTSSGSYASTPQTELTYIGTPSSSLASPVSACSPNRCRTSSEHRILSSPMASYRTAPYSLDSAFRQRSSMSLPSRRKPPFGQSLSEGFVPQITAFNSALSQIRGENLTENQHQTLRNGLGLKDTANEYQYQSQEFFQASLEPSMTSQSLQQSEPAEGIDSPRASFHFIYPANATPSPPIVPSSPPPEDMNPSNPMFRPVQQKPQFVGDVYTAKYKRRTPRGPGEGWCGICQPGRWLDLKNSRYWEDKYRNHGICAATRKPFDKPVAIRIIEGCDTIGRDREALCGECGTWVWMDTSRKRWTAWWTHAYKCHKDVRNKDRWATTGENTNLPSTQEHNETAQPNTGWTGHMEETSSG